MKYEKTLLSWDNLEISDYLDLLHDDYGFTVHSTGKVSNIKNMDPDFITKAMQATEYKDRRCIYKNEDVLVEHRVAKYPSGDREAVLLVHKKRDGLLFRTETGAAPLPSKD